MLLMLESSLSSWHGCAPTIRRIGRPTRQMHASSQQTTDEANRYSRLFIAPADSKSHSQCVHVSVLNALLCFALLCFSWLGFAWPTNGAELADEAAAAARPDEAVALACDGVAVDAVGVCLSRKLRRNDSAAGYVSPAKQDQHPPARHCPAPPRHQRHQRHRPGPGVST